MLRKKPQINRADINKEDEGEDVIYDAKFISEPATTNNKEYQSVSIVKKVNKTSDMNNQAKRNAAAPKTFYSHLNQLLNLSNQSVANSKEAININMNNIFNQDEENKKVKTDDVCSKETSLNSINEFHAAIKLEKEIPIDRLKLFGSNSTAGVSFKKNNIELEQDRKESNRLENRDEAMGDESKLIGKNSSETNNEDKDDENGRLNDDYEVNFIAYSNPSFINDEQT